MGRTLTTRIEDLENDMSAFQKRIEAYEIESKTNNALLLAVKQQVDALVAIGKWLLGLLTTLGVGLLIAYLAHFWH